MTYTVSSGTLNPTQLNWPTLQFYLCVYLSYVSFVCWYVAPSGECYYKTILYDAAVCMLFQFHSIAQRIFNKIKVRASSSYARLRLCQILFLSWPPLVTFKILQCRGEKSHTQSLTQLIWCPGNQSLHLGTYCKLHYSKSKFAKLYKYTKP